MEEVRKSRDPVAARTLIEKDPGLQLRHRAPAAAHAAPRGARRGSDAGRDGRRATPSTSRSSSRTAIEAELLDERLAQYDLEAARRGARSPSATCSSATSACRRSTTATSCTSTSRRIELPQAFFMRVAMGLALNEIDREARAIEFYNVLSTLRLHELDADAVQLRHAALAALVLLPDDGRPTTSTASTRRSRKTRCCPSSPAASATTGRRCARWARTSRAPTARSQGVVPFLKVVNDTAVAVNQGGKRKGAVCSYLETWHLDIEEFLELRKNTGDDRRRTHDMNTANWIPDLFMKRVMEDGDWTLFSPVRRARPARQVRQGVRGGLPRLRGARPRAASCKLYKKMPALQLWRKMLSMLFETGHPWITFKDPCNIRSPQQHVGVVHSSNLCTEITLNTSATEIAVCNLGSVNLLAHMKQPATAAAPWSSTTPSCKRTIAHRDAHARQRHRHQLLRGRQGAQLATCKHRPVGLGIMGFQDCLHLMRMPYASRGGGGVRRPLDGGGLLLRVLGLDRARRGARPLLDVSAARCGTAASCRRTRSSCWREERGGYVDVDTSATHGLGGAARAHQAARHAQLQLRGDRADGDHLQHHRRVGVDRADLPEPVREVEPVGRVHGRQRVPGARPEAARPVGRGDGRRPQVLRRRAREDRPHAGRRCAASTPPRSRSTPTLAGRVRARAARSGSTRRSRSTSTWRARRARSSTRPTSSPGCAA